MVAGCSTSSMGMPPSGILPRSMSRPSESLISTTCAGRSAMDDAPRVGRAFGCNHESPVRAPRSQPAGCGRALPLLPDEAEPAWRDVRLQRPGSLVRPILRQACLKSLIRLPDQVLRTQLVVLFQLQVGADPAVGRAVMPLVAPDGLDGHARRAGRVQRSQGSRLGAPEQAA